MVALPLCASVSPLQAQGELLGLPGWMWWTLPIPWRWAVPWLPAASQACCPQGREAMESGNANVSAPCALCYLQDQPSSHGGNKLCRSAAAPEEQSLSAWLSNVLIKRRQWAKCQLCCWQFTWGAEPPLAPPEPCPEHPAHSSAQILGKGPRAWLPAKGQGAAEPFL